MIEREKLNRLFYVEDDVCQLKDSMQKLKMIIIAELTTPQEITSKLFR